MTAIPASFANAAGRPPVHYAPDPPHGALADRLQGVAMILVLAFGLWQGIAAMMTPAAQRAFEGKLNGAAMLEGKTAAAVNTIMAHDLPTDVVWRTIGGAIRWTLFGSGGPEVWVGTQGWLYLIDELRPWPAADANMRTRARIVQAVAAKLRDRGIQLVVAVVPDKARIERATLGTAPVSAQARSRYDAFRSLLHAENIDIVDLNETFAKAWPDGSLYYQTDTHWNQAGAALAAETIAAAAGFKGTAAFATATDPAETDRDGDLVRLMSLDALSYRWAPLLRPRPDRQHLQHTATATAAVSDDAGLLDDTPAVPVALVGSSYSLNSNFAGRLQEALHAEVTNLGKLGGGFAGAADGYFNGPTFKEAAPKLIVWEFPERVVGQPLDDADRGLAAWAGIDAPGR